MSNKLNIFFLGFILILFFGCSKQYSNRLVKSGKEYFENGEYDLALEDFNKAIKKNSSNYEAYLCRAKCYSFKGDNDAAISDCTTAINLNVDNVEAYRERAEVYQKIEKYEEAIADVSKMIDLEPNNVEFYEKRLALYQYNTSSDRIKDLLLPETEKILSLDPGRIHIYLFRAYYLSQHLGEHERAINEYSKAISIDPDNIEAFYERGKTYFEMLNDTEKALSDFNKITELDPSNTDAFWFRGTIYYTMKDYRRSLKEFNAASRIKSRLSNDEFEKWQKTVKAIGPSYLRDSGLTDGQAKLIIRDFTGFTISYESFTSTAEVFELSSFRGPGSLFDAKISLPAKQQKISLDNEDSAGRFTYGEYTYLTGDIEYNFEAGHVYELTQPEPEIISIGDVTNQMLYSPLGLIRF
jgi:tetratricopeptide (TPR) repeat protein